MPRVVLTVLILAFTVWCLVSIVQAPEGALRNLPRWAWLLLVLFFPLVGGIAYVIAGRPTDQPPRSYGARPAPRGPDDDEEFLRGL
ncbi:PLDc N-terminal domain-containing protein [Kineococcus endophyticus]|uniref:PLDc N-terminal domain-containing protein n=1 Tax=Kineococcus endophyticus TaxID=1181883 RepID=A0ABV3P3E2_9ACTN